MSAAAVQLEGVYCYLDLGSGHTAVIDAADLAAVSRYTWRLYTPSPSRTRRTHYARACINREWVYLHLFLWRLWGMRRAPVVDHENGNGLDCRRENLCRATVGQNNRRRGVQRNNTSGFKGVDWHKGAWRARVQTNGKRVVVGLYSSAEEAAEAYNRAVRRKHGRFAVLNVVKA